MPLAEPPQWSNARRDRLAQRYPVEFGNSDAKTVIGTDSYGIANGQAPTRFGTQAMNLAAHAGAKNPK